MLAAASATDDPGLKAEAMNSLSTIQILAEVPAHELEPQLQEALRLAQAANDPLLVGRALWNLGLVYRFHEPARSISFLQQAHELAQSRADDDARMRELTGYVLADVSVAYFSTGRLKEAGAAAREALAIFRALDHRPMVADLLGSMGSLEFMTGNPGAARAVIAEGLAISRAIGNVWTEAYGKFNLGDVEADAGNFDLALRLVEEGLEGARTVGFLPFVVMGGQQLINLYAELGRPDLARARAEDFVGVSLPETVPSMWRSMQHSMLGRLALEEGDLETAWSYLGPLAEENENRNRDIEAVFFGARAIAQTALRLGKTDSLQRFLDWVLPRLDGVRRYEGEFAYWRGRLRAALGERAGALADFERARALLVPAEATALLWYVDSALAQAYQASGNPERAAEAHGRAVAILERIAAGIADPELRRSFLGRPEVAQVLGTAGPPDTRPF
jgi:tetratricopeptide (TPR) repeat protein